RRHTRWPRDWSSDVCSSDLTLAEMVVHKRYTEARLTIYPAYFKESRANQLCTIVHELAHIHTAPIEELMDQAIKKGSITEKAKRSEERRVGKEGRAGGGRSQ